MPAAGEGDMPTFALSSPAAAAMMPANHDRVDQVVAHDAGFWLECFRRRKAYWDFSCYQWRTGDSRHARRCVAGSRSPR